MKTSSNQGFTLVGVLIFALVVGILASGVAPYYSTLVRGEKEQQLRYSLFCIRRGIKRYKDKYKKHPSDLEELVKEKMLRQIYPDPLTGKPDWEIILGKDLGIMDIKSTSTKKALKEDKDGKENTYDKW